MANFKKINLNLLLHLHALLTERKVSAAADKVFISQPAMSSSLKHLREIFKDPLLIFDEGEYFLSPEAEKLLPELELFMLQIQNILTPKEKFDPGKSNRIFKIALPDYIELLLLPYLLTSLEKYPNIVIDTTINAMVDKPALFIEKNMDIVIGAIDENTALSQLKVRKLFEEKLVCFASNKNPLIKNPLSLNQYLESRHLTFSFNEKQYSSSAEFLRKKKLTRHDVMYVNNILPAIFAVANTESIISIAPKVLIDIFAKQFDLAQQPLPFDLEPIPIYLITHRKDQSDEGIQWLSALVAENIEKLISLFP